MAKALALRGREPAVKASPAHPVMVVDAMGRNTTKWTQAVEGKPEGPDAICIVINEGTQRVYLSPEEAWKLARDIAAIYDVMVPVEPSV